MNFVCGRLYNMKTLYIACRGKMRPLVTLQLLLHVAQPLVVTPGQPGKKI